MNWRKSHAMSFGRRQIFRKTEKLVSHFEYLHSAIFGFQEAKKKTFNASTMGKIKNSIKRRSAPNTSPWSIISTFQYFYKQLKEFSLFKRVLEALSRFWRSWSSWTCPGNTRRCSPPFHQSEKDRSKMDHLERGNFKTNQLGRGHFEN